MPAGRPTSYSEMIADSICEEIAIGRSILSITADPNFPSENTVYRWKNQFPEFREKYMRAREDQADHYASEIIGLADTPVIAERRTIKADGSEEVVIGDAVDRTRLQIDARKWYASKLAPKVFGDKVQQEVTGKDGGPIHHKIDREEVIEKLARTKE